MIDTAFLQDVAEYVDSRVAKVVLNGTYVITNFEVKQVTGNVLALKYLIPVADVSLVTSIELKDAADNVISTNNVNIPITADHLMIQSITVKEGDA
jgi:hypothetical protein